MPLRTTVTRSRGTPCALTMNCATSSLLPIQKSARERSTPSSSRAGLVRSSSTRRSEQTTGGRLGPRASSARRTRTFEPQSELCTTSGRSAATAVRTPRSQPSSPPAGDGLQHRNAGGAQLVGQCVARFQDEQSHVPVAPVGGPQHARELAFRARAG